MPLELKTADEKPYKYAYVYDSGQVCTGRGTIHSVCIGSSVAGFVRLYDNTAASGTIVATIGGGAAGSVCFIVDGKFNTGLYANFLGSTPNNAGVTVSYRLAE